MHERFTDRSRKVMQLANQEAQRFHHEYIGTEHILLGLVQEGGGVAANVLKNLDLDLRKIRLEVEKIAQRGPDSPPVVMGKLPYTPRAQKAIGYSIEEARILNHNYVGTEHLLLGLLREQQGIAAQVLINLGLKLEDVYEEILNLLGHHVPDSTDEGEPTGGKGKSKTPALDRFGRDLTELARQGKLDPVIGRSNEIERVIQILSRRQKNNPVLLGEAGVGKTAIVEGLAKLIVDSNVPERLRDRRLVVLDLAMIASGTEFHDTVGNHIQGVINEVRRAGNTILVIDGLQRLASGRFREAGDLINLALAQGQIACIGTTTLEDFRKLIAADREFDRVFQMVLVAPPSAAKTLQILQGLRARYEAHHRVSIRDDALTAAVDLSTLYLPEQHFLQKAINLIDEAGARVRLKATTAPPDLKDIDEQMEKLNREKEEAVADMDFRKAAERREQCDKLKSKKAEVTKKWREGTEGVVDEEAVVDALSSLTGIPAELIRRRDTSVVPQRPRLGTAGLPAFERLQCDSVLQGEDVGITPGFGLVLIPHDDRSRELYDAAIRPALADNGIEAKIAGDIYEPGTILNEVWAGIRTAEVIVADVSDQNPSVVYELGLCFGLHRFPIILVRDPAALPFNVRALRHIRYDDTVAGSKKLKEELSAAVREFLSATRAAPPGL